MTKLDTSGKFAQLVIRELGDGIVDRTVQENIQKVGMLLFPGEYMKSKGDIQEILRIFWIRFHEVYIATPDIFPEKQIFDGIFSVPIGLSISEASLIFRARTLALFLITDLDKEWDFIDTCYNK